MELGEIIVEPTPNGRKATRVVEPSKEEEPAEDADEEAQRAPRLAPPLSPANSRPPSSSCLVRRCHRRRQRQRRLAGRGH